MNLIIKKINHGLINDILIYLAHNEGKSVIAGRFIKTLKGKIYK